MEEEGVIGIPVHAMMHTVHVISTGRQSAFFDTYSLLVYDQNALITQLNHFRELNGILEHNQVSHVIS